MPRREWWSLLWASKWPRRRLMLCVRSATWPSGDPVSPPPCLYSRMISAFPVAPTAMFHAPVSMLMMKPGCPRISTDQPGSCAPKGALPARSGANETAGGNPPVVEYFTHAQQLARLQLEAHQIGRASCRGRVEDAVRDGGAQ